MRSLSQDDSENESEGATSEKEKKGKYNRLVMQEKGGKKLPLFLDPVDEQYSKYTDELFCKAALEFNDPKNKPI